MNELKPLLPGMPEPFGYLHDASGNDPLTFVRILPENMALLCSTMPVLSLTQVRALQIATWNAARDYFAGLCDSQEGDGTTRAVAKGCAAAIRQSPDPVEVKC